MNALFKHHDQPVGTPTPVPGYPVPNVEHVTAFGENVLWFTFAGTYSSYIVL
jgi:hypothetical protein